MVSLTPTQALIIALLSGATLTGVLILNGQTTNNGFTVFHNNATFQNFTKFTNTTTISGAFNTTGTFTSLTPKNTTSDLTASQVTKNQCVLETFTGNGTTKWICRTGNLMHYVLGT